MHRAGDCEGAGTGGDDVPGALHRQNSLHGKDLVSAVVADFDAFAAGGVMSPTPSQQSVDGSPIDSPSGSRPAMPSPIASRGVGSSPSGTPGRPSSPLARGVRTSSSGSGESADSRGKLSGRHELAHPGVYAAPPRSPPLAGPGSSTRYGSNLAPDSLRLGDDFLDGVTPVDVDDDFEAGTPRQQAGELPGQRFGGGSSGISPSGVESQGRPGKIRTPPTTPPKRTNMFSSYDSVDPGDTAGAGSTNYGMGPPRRSLYLPDSGNGGSQLGTSSQF